MAENDFQVNESIDNQPKEEKASVGLAILSFLVPIAGLIIFLVEKDKRPKTAKTSGICALVSFILSILCSVIMTIAGGALFAGIVGEMDEELLDEDIPYVQEDEDIQLDLEGLELVEE